MYKPSPRQAAMLLLHALEERGGRRRKPMTRARLSRLTLTKLWNREQLDEAWIRDVNEWLLSAGWVLIGTGGTLGIVKTDVVANWPRVASKHTKDVLDQVALGVFDFAALERLLQTKPTSDPEPVTVPSKPLTPAKGSHTKRPPG